jgi:DNA-binding NarL/FixJ family response regulator
VVIGPEFDNCLAVEAINAGSRGVLPSSEPLRVVIAAVRLVMAGGTYFPVCIRTEPVASERGEIERSFLTCVEPKEEVGAISVAPQPAARRTGPDIKFTGREVQVLAALQRGRSNKWIASQLNLSENTVKVYIKHIMRKLNATNRTQAAIYSQAIGTNGSEPVIGPM